MNFCPWKEEILEGMLSNDVIGFQVRKHRDNFLNTVDSINQLEKVLNFMLRM